MADDAVHLTLLARSALGLNQRTLGDLLRVSKRTVQRWDAGRSTPTSFELGPLAVAVHAKDPALAARIAACAGRTLEQLGIRPPAPPPPPPAPAPKEPSLSPALARHLVDAVVCAAADAFAVTPSTVRPILLAAFRKASDAGLTVADVLSGLSPAPPARGKSGKPHEGGKDASAAKGA